jgi:hypothetical protein
MDNRQLIRLIEQVEALKDNATDEFKAGVDAVKKLLQTIAQEAVDRTRMQKLEEELTQLRARYMASGGQPTSKKRRGRKPEETKAQE